MRFVNVVFLSLAGIPPSNTIRVGAYLTTLLRALIITHLENKKTVPGSSSDDYWHALERFDVGTLSAYYHSEEFPV